ncbi:MAG: HAD-IIIA family hydrolase [Bdellovibrionaceae bacterium]|nr:HAD-IIIA family hydrolase [Pseudobdellovibrionaceae bacterium]
MRVAAFDVDETLRFSSGKKHYPESINEQILPDDVAPRIRQLREAGYLIALFSNQSGAVLPRAIEARRQILFDLANRLHQQNAPVDYVDIADGLHPWRSKPNPSMWDRLEQDLAAQGLRVDRLGSFVVGDAGYRETERNATNGTPGQDHDNFDREFARARGLAFFHADSFFARTSTPPGLDPMKWRAWQQETARVTRAVLEKMQELEAAVERVARSTQGVSPLNPSGDANARALGITLDDLNRAEFRSFLKMTEQIEQGLELIARSNSNAEEFAWIQSLLEKCRISRASYIRVEELYGTPKDNQRYNAFRDVILSYDRLLSAMGATAQPTPETTLWRRFLTAVQFQIRSVWMLTKLGMTSMGPLLRLWTGIFLTPNTGPGHTPITTATIDLFERWGRASGLNVDIEGRDRIPKAGPREINIYLPNHIDANLDFYVLSQLEMENFVTVGALNIKGTAFFSFATSGIFEPLLKQIMKNDHFFLVGQGERVLDRMVEAFHKGKSRHLLFFSQGMVSLGFQETNPVRDGLMRMIVRLRDEGFRVNLVPVIMPDNNVYLSTGESLQLRSDTGPQMSASVGTVITDEMLTQITAQGRLDAIPDWLRAHWVTGLRNDRDRVAGLRRWSHGMEEFERRGWVPASQDAPPSHPRNCETLFGPTRTR